MCPLEIQRMKAVWRNTFIQITCNSKESPFSCEAQEHASKTIQKQIMWIRICWIPETNQKTRVVCKKKKEWLATINILSPFPPSTACPKALANPWLLEVGAGSCDVKCWLFLVAGGDVSSFFRILPPNKWPPFQGIRHMIGKSDNSKELLQSHGA